MHDENLKWEEAMTKTEILHFLISHKEEIFSQFSLKSLGLFGSYAKEKATEDSDIDIVISTDKKDFFLRDDLREYLQNSLGKQVDVGYLDSIREYYKEKVQKDIIYV